VSDELHPEQVEALRRLTPARRLEIGLQFMEEMRQLKAATLQMQHPEWSQEQVARALREFVRHGAT
jgi:DUF1365 family protein